MVEFEVPLYGGKVRIYTSPEEFSEEYERLQDEEIDLEDHKGIVSKMFIFEEEEMIYMLGVFDGKLTTLVHECGHIAIFIAERAGWEITSETSEPFCYLLDTLFKMCLQHIPSLS